jgi:hypothetical protein
MMTENRTNAEAQEPSEARRHCVAGFMTKNPCEREATEEVLEDLWLCEEHVVLHELGERHNAYYLAVDILSDVLEYSRVFGEQGEVLSGLLKEPHAKAAAACANIEAEMEAIEKRLQED